MHSLLDGFELAMVDPDIAETFRNTEPRHWPAGGPLRYQQVRELGRLAAAITRLAEALERRHDHAGHGGHGEDDV